MQTKDTGHMPQCSCAWKLEEVSPIAKDPLKCSSATPVLKGKTCTWAEASKTASASKRFSHVCAAKVVMDIRHSTAIRPEDLMEQAETGTLATRSCSDLRKLHKHFLIFHGACEIGDPTVWDKRPAADAPSKANERCAQMSSATRPTSMLTRGWVTSCTADTCACKESSSTPEPTSIQL